MMETIMEFLPVFIASLLGAIVPAIVSLYASFKAKAAADGVKNWRDDAVKFVDGLADGIANPKAPE